VKKIKEICLKIGSGATPKGGIVMVNRFIVHVSSLPEKYQEMVRQARAEGKDISLTTN